MEREVPVLIVTHGPGRLGDPRAVRAGRPARAPRAGGAASRRRPLDPTGVGDAYRAGLLRGLRIGAPWPVAGRIGSVGGRVLPRAPGPPAAPLHAGGVPGALRPQLRRDARARPAVHLGLASGYNSSSSKEVSSLSMRVPRRAAASFSPRQYEGSLDAAGLRVGVVCARWNPTMTDAMLDGRPRHAAPARRPRGRRLGGARARRLRGRRRARKALIDAGRFHAVVALAAIVRGRDHAPRGARPRGRLRARGADGRRRASRSDSAS